MTLSDQQRTENYHKRIADKGVITSKISDSCRFVGFGLLAVFYAIKTDANEFTAKVLEAHPTLVFCVGLFGALAVLFDYFQYLAAHISVERALKRTETYDYPHDLALAARYAFYFAKQAAVGIGVSALVWIILQT